VSWPETQGQTRLLQKVSRQTPASATGGGGERRPCGE